MKQLVHVVFGIVRRISGFAVFFAVVLSLVHLQTRHSIWEIRQQHVGKGLAAAADSREARQDASRWIKAAKVIGSER